MKKLRRNRLKSYIHIPLEVIQNVDLTSEFRFACCLLLTYSEFEDTDVPDIFKEYGINNVNPKEVLNYLYKIDLLEKGLI